MTKENKAIFEMLTCAALWSIAGIFIKLIPWSPFAISCIRSLFAGITILVFIGFKHYKIIFNRRTLTAGIIMGFVYTSFVAANKLTTAANAIVLQFTAPLFIVIFSAIIFKKKILRKDLIAVLFTMLGIALFFFDQIDAGKIAGNFVAILAGALMGGMYMAMGEAHGEERFSAILVGQITAFLIGLPFVIMTKPEFTAIPVVCIIILGVFQLGIPYILYGKASEFCPPLACCLLGAVEPLLNPIWVLIFDGEKPGLYALIGGIIVIASVTIWCAVGNKSKEENHA
ncbi:MAG: EamA family transporter [Bacillota bacterium]|nr:EamA family transporter [Bacillota bacterium]